MNFQAGETRANRVIVPVGSDGRINVYNARGATHVLVDVVGWFTDASSTAGGATYVSMSAPTRISDSRTGGSAANTPWGPGVTKSIPVAGRLGVPGMTSANPPVAIVGNLTITRPTVGGYLIVFASGTRPLSSDINFAKGATTANMILPQLASNGSFAIYNVRGTVDVLVDVYGWFA